MPEAIKRRVLRMSAEGKSPAPVLRFYERLQKNPSWRSVQQLFPFLEKFNIPITDDGCFLAYKKVNDDYTDKHSGTISNRPGTTVILARNLVSDDPKEPCHFGLHVGAPGYVGTFGGYSGKIVVCKVDPEFVVCVPEDCSQEKMRVCQYKVIGNRGDDLPTDVMDGEDELENLHDNEAIETTEEEIDNTKQLKDGDAKTGLKGKKAITRRIEKKIDKSKYSKFDKFNVKDLMEQSLDDLRKYATYGLEIVRASKIAGGKAALVGKIMKARPKS